jgi:hypothetical protein
LRGAVDRHRGAAGSAPERAKEPLGRLLGLIGERCPETLDLLQEVAERRRGRCTSCRRSLNVVEAWSCIVPGIKGQPGASL